MIRKIDQLNKWKEFFINRETVDAGVGTILAAKSGTKGRN